MHIEQVYRLFLECSSICIDTRKIEENCLFFALKGERFNGNLFADEALEKGAKCAIIDDPSLKGKGKILVDNTLHCLQDLANFHRRELNIPIIGLTGSNGKTTTKELIATVLSKKYQIVATQGNFNNHIGLPLTLLSMNESTQIGVVEMGANHLGEIKALCEIALPDYGYITNFGKAHLEGFGGIEGVIKGKCELYDHLIAHDKSIFINANDRIQIEKTINTQPFSFGKPRSNADVEILFEGANPYVRLKFRKLSIDTQLIGHYNAPNLMAALTIGLFFEVPVSNIKKALENYCPQNNRSQILKRGDNRIIMDAYNANPSSMNAALNSLSEWKGKKIAILGDMFELGTNSLWEHQQIVNLLQQAKLNESYLIGQLFSQTRVKKSSIQLFQSLDEFKTHLATQPPLQGANILIKGSRGMKMESLLDLLWALNTWNRSFKLFFSSFF